MVDATTRISWSRCSGIQMPGRQMPSMLVPNSDRSGRRKFRKIETPAFRSWYGRRGQQVAWLSSFARPVSPQDERFALPSPSGLLDADRQLVSLPACPVPTLACRGLPSSIGERGRSDYCPITRGRRDGEATLGQRFSGLWKATRPPRLQATALSSCVSPALPVFASHSATFACSASGLIGLGI